MIFLEQDHVLGKTLESFPGELKKEIEFLHTTDQFTGESGQVFPLIFRKKIILLAGLGKKEELTLMSLRATVRKALQASFLKKIKNVEMLVPDPTDDVMNAVLEAVLIGNYTWRKYRTENSENKTVDDKHIFLVAGSKKVFEETRVICEGVNFTRDLINDNADVITSEYMEGAVRRLIKDKKNVSVEILNKKELKAKGLGLHLAVNQGSKKEPKLMIVQYHGSSKKDDTTALVGKGLTFDTGGLNLKPTGSMETMRTDMSGAAAVLGVLKNVLSLNVKKNILFVIALAENVIGSQAYKPGDVIKGYAGKTVEVGNTDAEGRLVLADAISYTIKNYKPSRLIDIATLTGACVVALGYDYSGLVSPDEQLASQLLRSSEQTDDRVWRLPIYAELKDAIKSKVADIRNIGFAKGAAGALTAAEFLHQFTENTPWAHLDIAGTAFVEGDGRMYFGHGATGAGVRLLTHFLRYN
ncbi:MAG: hypothetical protein A2Z81_03370 [Omnitrophica WOR_2 bacterium GWA2_45_18]|nr:MAG: hypothetical protein A2Z81_03370 [Omnitrophica WOR_2 bacterium GWA2_45_18]